MNLALVFMLLLAQDAPANPKVDQKRVDEAIARGVAFLKSARIHVRHEELVLLTLVHSGIPDSDARLQELLANGTAAPLEHTYNVSVLAMALEELNRVAHQRKIWECAQFLVDNQWPSGQWGYGEPTEIAPTTPTGTPAKSVATAASSRSTRVFDVNAPGTRSNPPVKVRIPVKKQRDGKGERGDNSCSQYAALGLRACHDAGIILPEEVVKKGRQWWIDSKTEENKKPGVATGGVGHETGWSYSQNSRPGGKPWGSMTVGAVGGLCIYDYILGIKWKTDPDVLGGINWIAAQFTVSENPQKSKVHHLYYLYGLERAGILYGTEFFGKHEWYPEGANWLIDNQGPNGSWAASPGGETEPVNTCFAILFLRRATKPLQGVASVDRMAR